MFAKLSRQMHTTILNQIKIKKKSLQSKHPCAGYHFYFFRNPSDQFSKESWVVFFENNLLYMEKETSKNRKECLWSETNSVKSFFNSKGKTFISDVRVNDLSDSKKRIYRPILSIHDEKIQRRRRTTVKLKHLDSVVGSRKTIRKRCKNLLIKLKTS